MLDKRPHPAGPRRSRRRSPVHRPAKADALGVAGADRFTCGCGNSDCPSSAATTGRQGHLTSSPTWQQSRRCTWTHAYLGPEPALSTRSYLRHPGGQAAGRADRGVVPAPLLAELIRGGPPQPRAVRDLRSELLIGPAVGRWPNRPIRDMTCRTPRLRPAHRILRHRPHTALPTAKFTHPSNLKCLCRKHHTSQDLLDRLA